MLLRCSAKGVSGASHQARPMDLAEVVEDIAEVAHPCAHQKPTWPRTPSGHRVGVRIGTLRSPDLRPPAQVAQYTCAISPSGDQHACGELIDLRAPTGQPRDRHRACRARGADTNTRGSCPAGW